ncbi:WD40 repeat domain-containing protein [Longispora sp. NPDC051575]|uniref:WD40 repeat domain-containing protein n=1 Tax=Longispora sp. NPDC051575 TaxID=3154943 RepID=UPI00341FE34B
MIGHRAPISGIATYRDEYVATAGYDNQVILFDQRGRRALTRVSHDHLANQCAFSPDGRVLVTASSDYTARLWSVPDLRLLAVLADHEDDVEMAAFHPDRALVATASRDHRIRLYDLTGRLTHRFAGHTADVISVVWSHDGTELISSSDDGTVKRWSLKTGALVEDMDLGGVETDTVAIGADGTIYAGNDEGEILVITDGNRKALPAHAAGVKRLVLGAEQGLLVSLSYDRTLRLWHVAGGTLTPAGGADLPPDVWPRSCAFAADSTLVFGTFGALYRTYDYAADRWLDEEVPPTQGLNAVCGTPDGVWAAGDAGVVWRVAEGRRTEQAVLGSLANFLTPSPSGPVLAGGQLGQIFDARTGRVLHRHRSPLNCAAVFHTATGWHAVVGAYTGEGIVLRLDGTPERVVDVQLHANAIKGVAVSGGMIFSVCADGGVAWHDAETYQLIRRVPAAHDKIVNGCAALSAGRFASVSRDRTLRLWSADFHVATLHTPHEHSIKCVAASPDGVHVATGAYDGRIAVYDTITETWADTHRPTTSGISSLAYDAGRGIFLASAYDGQVYEVPR